MNDLISRQAAIDMLRTMQTYKMCAGDELILVDKAEVMTQLMMLPAAQPTQTNAESTQKWQKDFREYIEQLDLLRDDYRGIMEYINEVPAAQPVITCDGCRHVGTYDTDFPCCSCIRREKDYYEPE